MAMIVFTLLFLMAVLLGSGMWIGIELRLFFCCV